MKYKDKQPPRQWNNSVLRIIKNDIKKKVIDRIFYDKNVYLRKNKFYYNVCFIEDDQHSHKDYPPYPNL